MRWHTLIVDLHRLAVLVALVLVASLAPIGAAQAHGVAPHSRIASPAPSTLAPAPSVDCGGSGAPCCAEGIACCAACFAAGHTLVPASGTLAAREARAVAFAARPPLTRPKDGRRPPHRPPRAAVSG